MAAKGVTCVTIEQTAGNFLLGVILVRLMIN